MTQAKGFKKATRRDNPEKILKNVSLGEEHLYSILTSNENQKLLKQIDVNKRQKMAVTSDKKEKTGRTALVVNTIITSCLGGWLGISAYSHMKLNNILQF